MDTKQKLEIALKALRDISARRQPGVYGSTAFGSGYKMGLTHQAEIADLALMNLLDPVELPGDSNDEPDNT